MNKHIAEFFTSNGMTISGNNAYGVVRGYETFGILLPLEPTDPFKLHVACYATEEQKHHIIDCLNRAEIKKMNFTFTEFGLYVGLNDFTIKKLADRLPSIAETIFGVLSESGALGYGYCPSCGAPIENPELRKRNVEGVEVTVCDECIGKLNETISADNKEFEQAPNNYVLGFCGALIGGLVGGALAVGLYLLGFVSSISAIVAVLLGAFLYQKFHGKPNAMMIVIVAATTLVCMAASVFIIYLVASGIAAVEEGVTLTAMEAFVVLMGNEEFSRAFYGDLAMSLIFSVIGIVFEIFYLSKKIKRQKNIK